MAAVSSTVPPVEVIPLEGHHIKPVIDSLTRAFSEDPVYMHLFPLRSERHYALSSLWRGVLSYCRLFGKVYTTPDARGAACWLSPGKTVLTFWRSLRSWFALQRALGNFNRQARREFLDTLNYLEDVHKEHLSDPQWYLWALGVHPDAQGQGIGSSLMQPVLAQADTQNATCYLETMNEANLDFYEKNGFQVVREDKLPMNDLGVWMMLRAPNGQVS